MKKPEETGAKERPEKFVEGVDYYFEKGLMVLTAHFLLKRGYCCENDCRNCPYRQEPPANL